MNITRNPELMDRLAAEYALGTLRGGARRRYEKVARQSPALRVAAQVWQERLMAITELQHAEKPAPHVWTRIENLVSAERAPVAAPSASSAAPSAVERLQRLLGFWRGAAFAGGLATLAALVVTFQARDQLQGTSTELAQLQSQGRELAQRNAQLVAQLQAQPDIRYVAVLADDKAAASMLATFDPKHNTLTLKRVGGFQEAADKSLQLWALPTGGAPRSLGVLGTEAVARLTAAEQVVGQSPVLAISLEPRGGVPGEGGPTGPVLFKGAVLQTPL